MSLSSNDAATLLRTRFGPPINPVQFGRRKGEDNKKVLGFKMPDGRVLALDRSIKGATHIWFEPAASDPTEVTGITIRSTPKNSNLSGPLAALSDLRASQVQVDSETALHEFMDWYERREQIEVGTSNAGGQPNHASKAEAEADRGSVVVAPKIESDVSRTTLDQAIGEMWSTVETTVNGANGQVVQHIVKSKELKLTKEEFGSLIKSLLKVQNNRCALTGISLDLNRSRGIEDLFPSVDRIDSDKHYEHGNIQIVCRFINFWKSATDNEKFKQLLALVRSTPA